MLGSFRPLLLVALLFAAGCPSPAPPNVVLVSVDTLRADALGAYGGPFETPSFDSLARDGTLFEVALAPAAETAPSHATLLTGRRLLEHGVRKNGVRLAEERATLAEAFAEAGYATGAFVSSFVLDPRFGWSQGFDVYDAEFSKEGQSFQADRIPNPEGFWHAHEFGGFDRAGHLTSRAARQWLAEAPRPFFLFVHYFDPHEPHNPTRAHLGRVARAAPDWSERMHPEVSPAEVTRWNNRYQAEVLGTDDALAGLLAALSTPELRDTTLVAVTGDHGQGLGQHGWLGHQIQLYDEQIRVPLLLRWPGRIPAGVRIATPVGIEDVAPTLAELAGIPLPGTREGRSLATAVREGGAPEARAVYAYRRHYATPRNGHLGDQHAVRTPDWKYIEGSRGTRELYDLGADPGELANLAAERPTVVARLGALIGAWKERAAPTPPAVPLSDETRQGLEALGYVE